MPRIQTIRSITFDARTGRDVSKKIAPPYDVLDATSKADLLSRDEHNIVAIDLPHTPAKALGPDATYQRAGETYRDWLKRGVLVRTGKPTMYVYQQTFTVGATTFKRRGLLADVAVQAFGKSPDGHGGVYPHEQTFSEAKQDRLKLMTATGVQLSPIFGLYSDPERRVEALLDAVIAHAGEPTMHGRTLDVGVLHELWAVERDADVKALTDALRDADIFIADGHHRYNTAINYRQQLIDAQGAAGGGKGLPDSHGANWCMFALVSMQDPGMVVLPTHRVLGAMTGFSVDGMVSKAGGRVSVTPFAGGDLAALEAALPKHGPHAMGLVEPASASSGRKLSIMTTRDADPLAATHGDHCEAWRQLDVAILQHLLVEQVLQPAFCGGGAVKWKFPHALADVDSLLSTNSEYQLGVILQPTPLGAVRAVSEAGELMPQKSTFFYPKIATGCVINDLSPVL